LVTLSNNVVAIGTLHNEDDKRWHLEPASMMIAYPEDSVIAWMPLPKPYREEREDYELATEQMEHDAMYEPTYNSEDGSNSTSPVS
jgi:hypothetical protein